MNRNRSILMVAAVGLCLASTFTGCVTTPLGHKVVDPALTEKAAEESAYFTGTALKSKYAEELTLTANSLDALVAVGSGTADNLRAALQTLPVTSLAGENSNLIVGDGSILLNQGGTLLVSLDKSEISTYYVIPIARGLAAGLHRALAQGSTSIFNRHAEELCLFARADWSLGAGTRGNDFR